MQDHVWIVQAYFSRTRRWANYTMTQSRAEARAVQKFTGLKTRIRKFIAA